MKYIFTCSNKKCNITMELEKAMSDEFSKDQLKCSCGGELKRDYLAESGSKKVIIPEHMRGVYQSQTHFDYSKGPSQGKKHLFGGYTGK